MTETYAVQLNLVGRKCVVVVVVVGGGSGTSPRLAAVVRDHIDSLLPVQYGILSRELARARRIVKSRVADPKTRTDILAALCTECSIKLIKTRDVQAWRIWFARVLEHRLRKGEDRTHADPLATPADTDGISGMREET